MLEQQASVGPNEGDIHQKILEIVHKEGIFSSLVNTDSKTFVYLSNSEKLIVQSNVDPLHTDGVLGQLKSLQLLHFF